MTKISDDHDYPRLYQVTAEGYFKLFYFIEKAGNRPYVDDQLNPSDPQAWHHPSTHRTESNLLQQRMLQLERLR